jgi:endonuclease/exonuclease/phosphatase family metal-dependent hydrolase
MTSCSSVLPFVRVLTFNIYFDPIGMSSRMKAIGQLIERLRPAVIGFQEVTNTSFEMLQQQKWTKYYDCSLEQIRPFSEAYFVVLYSALPVLSIENFPFQTSGMGRELLWMKIEIEKQKTLTIGTSHLESLPRFGKERIKQMKKSFELLERSIENDPYSIGAIFMGDMNFFRTDFKYLLTATENEDDDNNHHHIKTDSFSSHNIQVELAKSNRSKCRTCNQTIAKDTLRMGKIETKRLPNGKTVEVTQWQHQDCFYKTNENNPSLEKPELFKGFGNLMEEIQADLKTRCCSQETTAKKTIDLATYGLPNSWIDLWLSIPGNTEENGYTYDGKKNGLVSNHSYQNRFDRMYFYPGQAFQSKKNPTLSTRTIQLKTGETKHFLKKIEMIGQEPIQTLQVEKKNPYLWPSDHFGLLATFDFNNKL